jgi:hypothetical protein
VNVGSLMDAATSDAITVGVSFFPVITSTDGGKTYTECSVHGISQDANVFPPSEGNQIGLVGSFQAQEKTPGINGVAHSADLGQTWSVKAVPAGSVRYGSFPTADTWYVTSGMWPAYSSTEGDHVYQFSSKLNVDKKTAKFYMSNSTSVTKGKGTTGYWGKISKTSDGGETWSTVFSSSPDDGYYFNSIACSDANTCVAVTEGDNHPDYRAYLTTDGGATWTDTLSASGVVPDNQVSMMGAGWISATEGWLAGTAKSGPALVGTFFKTADGGKTFTLAQVMTIILLCLLLL